MPDPEEPITPVALPGVWEADVSDEPDTAGVLSVETALIGPVGLGSVTRVGGIRPPEFPFAASLSPPPSGVKFEAGGYRVIGFVRLVPSRSRRARRLRSRCRRGRRASRQRFRSSAISARSASS